MYSSRQATRALRAVADLLDAEVVLAIMVKDRIASNGMNGLKRYTAFNLQRLRLKRILAKRLEASWLDEEEYTDIIRL
jgi:hypothetical protein